ncbi:MAG: hypothetical protein LBF43_01260 [Puniceicoccales bacterium]|jgi:hypothetical protein|nr:hypothetical protein [Puniceicoccales bacterium]
MSILGVPFRASPQSELQHSPVVANFQLRDELSRIFAGQSIQMVCELANRFDQQSVKPDQVQQIVDMLTLPDGIQLPQGRQLVSNKRLLNILLNLTQFQWGVQQLVDLTALCARNDLHLCFLTDDSYGFNSGDSLSRNHEKMLYVDLPEKPETLCSNPKINVATMQAGKLHIQQEKLLELLQSLEKVDGYSIGHELSHATVSAKCYVNNPADFGNAAREKSKAMETFFKAIVRQLAPDAANFLESEDEKSNLIDKLPIHTEDRSSLQSSTRNLEENLRFIDSLNIDNDKKISLRNAFNRSEDRKRSLENFLTTVNDYKASLIRLLTIDPESKANRRLIGLLQEALFSTGEEARNVLGLELNESFNRGNDFIVSEFDFLCEVTNYEHTNQVHIRMPYVSNVPTANPKVCMALLTLIFQLKEHSINSVLQLDDAVTALEMALRSYHTAQHNTDNLILPILSAAGYQAFTVHGDGNDGFYAILEALTPSDDFLTFHYSIKENDDRWNAAAALRQAIANMDPALARLRDMTTMPLGTEDQQMGFDDLPAVARHLHQQYNRPLIVIDATATPENQQPMFTYYDQNGTKYGATDFQAAMYPIRGMTPIILLYKPGHWDAVIPTPSEPPPNPALRKPPPGDVHCTSCEVA